MTQSYKDLIVWKKSIDLATIVYRCLKTFPKSEMFGIVSQMQRAVISIASNIAEGQGRRSDKEFSRFLSIAKGSLCELETQIIISEKVNYMTAETMEGLLDQCDELGRLLNGLIKSIESKLRSQPKSSDD